MKILDYYLSDVDSGSQAYARIRKTIGYCGIAIPLLCIAMSIAGDCVETILPSISHYYYTAIGDMFVGVLFALGLFLVLYKSVFNGEHCERLRRQENFLTNFSGIMAMIVAFIPTDPEGGDCYYITLAYPYKETFGYLSYLHLPAAGIMLLIFGYISLFYFPRDWKTGQYNSDNKRIYQICGITIFSSIGILILYFLDKDFLQGKYLGSLEKIKIVFLLECISIIAFAISWLKKGRAIGSLLHIVDEMKKSINKEPNQSNQ
ncbi:MAG: hypothetical protein R2831_08300 [Chitinophagaceae bacterium]